MFSFLVKTEQSSWKPFGPYVTRLSHELKHAILHIFLIRFLLLLFCIKVSCWLLVESDFDALLVHACNLSFERFEFVLFFSLSLARADKSKSISSFMLLVTNHISARATEVNQSIFITVKYTIVIHKVQKNIHTHTHQSNLQTWRSKSSQMHLMCFRKYFLDWEWHFGYLRHARCIQQFDEVCFTICIFNLCEAKKDDQGSERARGVSEAAEKWWLLSFNVINSSAVFSEWMGKRT